VTSSEKNSAVNQLKCEFSLRLKKFELSCRKALLALGQFLSPLRDWAEKIVFSPYSDSVSDGEAFSQSVQVVIGRALTIESSLMSA